MSGILNGKVVIVTGAASGIVRAISIAAARHGARLVIVSNVTETPREGGRATVEEIEALGGAAKYPLAPHPLTLDPRRRPGRRWRLHRLPIRTDR